MHRSTPYELRGGPFPNDGGIAASILPLPHDGPVGLGAQSPLAESWPWVCGARQLRSARPHPTVGYARLYRLLLLPPSMTGWLRQWHRPSLRYL